MIRLHFRRCGLDGVVLREAEMLTSHGYFTSGAWVLER